MRSRENMKSGHSSSRGKVASNATALHIPRMRKSDVGPSELGNPEATEHVSLASKWRGKFDTLKDFLHVSPPRRASKPNATGSPSVSHRFTKSPPTVKNKKPTVTEIPDTDNVEGNLEDTPKRQGIIHSPPSVNRSQSALCRRHATGRCGLAKSSILQTDEFIAEPEYQDQPLVRKRKRLPALPEAAHSPTRPSISPPKQGSRILQSRIADVGERCQELQASFQD